MDGLFERGSGKCRRIVEAGEVNLLAGIADRIRMVLAAAPQCAEIAATPPTDMPIDRRAVEC